MLKVMCYVFHRSVFVSRIDVSFPAFMKMLMHRLRSSFVSVCIEFLSPPKSMSSSMKSSSHLLELRHVRKFIILSLELINDQVQARP